ncbi:hypothetical protein Tco_1407900 [Tanacetum coccineum]
MSPGNTSADVARGHGGDGGSDDRPPPYQAPTGCGGKGTRKPNLGGRRAGRLHTRQETRNLGLKAITDKNGPVPIRFEFGDRETLMPLGEHAAHWANYLGELVRELPLYYPSWRQMPPERKAGVVEKIGTQFDLRPHMEGMLLLKDRHCRPDADVLTTYGANQLELATFLTTNFPIQIGMHRFALWNIPITLHGLAQNKQKPAKSKDGREHQLLESTLADPTFFLTHTIGESKSVHPEDKALIWSKGSQHPPGCALHPKMNHGNVRRAEQTGTHSRVCIRILPGTGHGQYPPRPPSTHTPIDVDMLKKREKPTNQVNMFMKLFRSDDKFLLPRCFSQFIFLIHILLLRWWQREWRDEEEDNDESSYETNDDEDMIFEGREEDTKKKGSMQILQVKCRVASHGGISCEDAQETRDENDVAFGVVCESKGWKKTVGTLLSMCLFESPRIYLLSLVSEIALAFGICIGFGIDIGIGIGLASALGLALLLGMIADVFDCLVTLLLYRFSCVWLRGYVFAFCKCVLLPGYTSALQIADVFSCRCVWLPMSALQIADLFGSESVVVCCCCLLLLSAVCCLLCAVCCCLLLLSAVAVCCCCLLLLSAVAVCCCCLLLPHPGQDILGPAPAIYASQHTTLPSAFSTMPLQDSTWHMDTGASSHLNFNASNLSIIFDKRLFPSVHVSDGESIPVTNTGHSIIPSHHRPLHLHNVLQCDFQREIVELLEVYCPAEVFSGKVKGTHIWRVNYGFHNELQLRRIDVDGDDGIYAAPNVEDEESEDEDDENP